MRLDDPRWKTLEGGYRTPYDASTELVALASGDAEAMARLWEELHHQGDVGSASYAAVSALVEVFSTRDRDWNFYGLVNIIETCRQGAYQRPNPPLPDWLSGEYRDSLSRAVALALMDLQELNVDGDDDAKETLKQILATIAIGKGASDIGILLSDFTNDEIAALNERKFEWT
jgi:hypothetical protein